MKSIPSPLRIMLTAVAIICPAVSLLAKDVTLSGYTYAGKNDKILVTYALNSTDMIARVKKVVDNNRPQKESCEIPPSITVDGKKYKVTKIGAKAFAQANNQGDYEDSKGNYLYDNILGFTKIRLPNTIVEIGDEAFCGLQFSTLELSTKVQTIGKYAFAYTNVTSVTIPATCTSIGTEAFGSTWKLKKLTFADGSKALTIGARAFEANYITSLTLPARITSIGDAAFKASFALTTLVVNANAATLPRSCFEQSAKLTSVTLNGAIQTIGDGAFIMCPNLSYIKWPTTLRSIGVDAFDGSKLSGAIVFPAGLQTIGNFAFYSCNGLTSVSLPASATSIGKYSFGNCEKITAVRCDAVNPPAMPEPAFDDRVYMTADLTVPNQSWRAYEAATEWKKFNYKKYHDAPVNDINVDTADESEAVYYDLNGNRVSPSALNPGIYIRRHNGKTEKIAIR